MLKLNRLQWLLLPLCLLIAQFSWAETVPDFVAYYQVNVKGLPVGKMKRSLTTDENGNKTLISKSEAKGLFSVFKPGVITETSHWHLDGDKVIADQYQYSRTGGKKEKQINALFDWSKSRMDVSSLERTWQLAINNTPLYDKQLYQIALMRDLSNKQPPFDYHITDGKRIKPYHIVKQSEQVIATGFGKLNSITLKREKQKNDRQTTLWCAPELHYLPIKIEHIEKDGTLFIAELIKLKGITIKQAIIE